MSNRSVRTLSISDTQLFQGSARNDDTLHATCLRRLIKAIVPYAHQLELVRFANIWGDNKLDPYPAFDANQGELELRGKDEIRLHLDRLSTQFIDRFYEEDLSSEDEDDDESDTN